MTTRRAQIEEIQRELSRQDSAWERAKQSLTTLGDVLLPVPQSVLEELEAPIVSPVLPVVPGVRG
jgi:hypothetical protein